jgi:hypothetical protein
MGTVERQNIFNFIKKARQDMQSNNELATISADGCTKHIYNDVAIVTESAESIILNCHGFMTHDTKHAMNKVGLTLGFHLRLLNNAWMVQYKGRSIPYINGMILSKKGK